MLRDRAQERGQDVQHITGLSGLLTAPFPLFIFVLSCPHCWKMSEKEKKKEEEKKKIKIEKRKDEKKN